jgi:hypothetical protein
MFYLHYVSWFSVYFVIWCLFNFRKFVLKYLNYPRYPETFEFDKLSIFWRWLLVYFYSENGFLSKLPLESKDVKKIIQFRKFIKFSFWSAINFNKKTFIKKFFNINSYNSYKFLYKIFNVCSKKSLFLNFFIGFDNFFLKFIIVKKFISSPTYFLFIFNYFYKPYSNNWFFYYELGSDARQKLIFLNFFSFVCITLFKFSKKLSFIEYYFRLNRVVLTKILNKKKKPLKVNNNFYYEDYLELLNFFLMCRAYMTSSLSNLYSKIWNDFIIKFDTRNSYTVVFKNFLKNAVVRYNTKFIIFFKYYWPVRLQNGIFTKFVDLNYNKNNLIFFLRKNKIFNKGRYSRNRQIYRTGVYMCLWINIIFVYFYIFAFYRFTFNFGFMWFGIGFFIISMVIGRASKYRFYNFKNFINEIFYFFNWLGFFGFNFWNYLYNRFGVFFKNFKFNLIR